MFLKQGIPNEKHPCTGFQMIFSEAKFLKLFDLDNYISM